MPAIASPQKIRRLCVGTGLLYFSFFLADAGWELHSGRAEFSRSRILGKEANLVAFRSRNPALYWEYLEENLLKAAASGGLLILFGQFIVWLNRLPGSKKTWD